MATKLKPFFNPATSTHNDEGTKLAYRLDEEFGKLFSEFPEHNPRELMFIAIDSITKIGIMKSIQVSEVINKEARLKD